MNRSLGAAEQANLSDDSANTVVKAVSAEVKTGLVQRWRLDRGAGCLRFWIRILSKMIAEADSHGTSFSARGIALGGTKDSEERNAASRPR